MARPDESRVTRTSPAAADGTSAVGGHHDVVEAAPRAEPPDAKWQSAIDAATD
jgi:hypothetical protein